MALFMKKNCKKTSLNENVINCTSNGKDTIIKLIVGLIKRHCIKMSRYFPKPFRRFGKNINVKVDFSNYVKKSDLKNVTHADTSRIALKKN